MTFSPKLELNLKEIAMIQIAVNCWKHREIKIRIKKFFQDCDILQRYWKLHQYHKEFTRKIIEKFRKEIRLPETTKNQLICIIAAVGSRMLEWLVYITDKAPDSNRQAVFVHCLDHTFFTVHGLVDEVRAFKSLYASRVITDIPFLYGEACTYCLPEYVDNLWRRASERDKKVITTNHKLNMGKFYNSYLFNFWHRSDKKSNLFDRSAVPSFYRNNYDFYQSPQVNNFRLSTAVTDGCVFTVVYFFHQLSDQEKLRNSVEAVEFSIQTQKMARNFADTDIITRRVDMLAFLVQQVPSFHASDLYYRSGSWILWNLLTHWPWKKLLLPVLRDFWNCIDSKDYEKLFERMIEAAVDEYEVCGVKRNISQRVLIEVWRETPDFLKDAVVRKFWPLCGDLLLKTEDVSVAKCIINDPHLAPQRRKLLDGGDSCYHNLMVQKKYHVIDQIIDEILYTDKERSNFKEKIGYSSMCTVL